MIKGDYKQSVSKFYDETGGGLVYGLIVYPIIGKNQHYGFWYPHTKTYKEAAENQIREIIAKANINQDSVVLDAGCGVGGPAVFIAKETNCIIHGVTLSAHEVSRALKYIDSQSLNGKVFISKDDYTKLSFPDNFFDVVYAIESVCHAVPKEDFFKEVFRVLKPSGRLIVSDGFRKRDPVNEKERRIIQTFMYGYELKEIVESRVYEQEAIKAGFIEVFIESKIQEVERPVIFFMRMTAILRPFTTILQYINASLKVLHRNVLAGYYSGKGIEAGIADYAVLVAKKP